MTIDLIVWGLVILIPITILFLPWYLYIIAKLMSYAVQRGKRLFELEQGVSDDEKRKAQRTSDRFSQN